MSNELMSLMREITPLLLQEMIAHKDEYIYEIKDEVYEDIEQFFY